jgi:hypothetical protein
MLARLVGVTLEQLLGRACLYGDDRHAMCDDVVQLARDPRSLLADRGTRELA